MASNDRGKNCERDEHRSTGTHKRNAGAQPRAPASFTLRVAEPSAAEIVDVHVRIQPDGLLTPYVCAPFRSIAIDSTTKS